MTLQQLTPFANLALNSHHDMDMAGFFSYIKSRFFGIVSKNSERCTLKCPYSSFAFHWHANKEAGEAKNFDETVFDVSARKVLRMADARVVANHLVEFAHQGGETLTPMQLLKLTYMAHGFSLGLYGNPLIENRIEAWKYGPVIPVLYDSIKRFGSNPVEGIETGGLESLKQSQKNLIEAVYENYKGLSGIALSNMTHANGTPWAQVYNAYDSNIPIPNDIIEEHYKELLSGA